MSDSTAPSDQGRASGGPLFWAGVVVGWVVMVIGVRGLLDENEASSPSAVGRLFVEAALIHDLLLAPIVCGLGVLIARFLKPPLRAIVGGGLIASAIIALYSFPFVRGYGRSPNLPSALPVNYGRGLAIILAGIWLVVIALSVWAMRRSRSVG
ncbi:MAG: hypothetical protein ACR2HV_01560 [Acidimicrobiales bacterium]